ncbi:helix-turn-helix domain-containing protein [Amycolatopsis sp. NPDC051061]|uniref:PucR family transcriptional regulator n=1 Tax=Amycolatopsis sp. NPDC051061 TaxID=3155042 RepID=UPI0034406B6C
MQVAAKNHVYRPDVRRAELCLRTTSVMLFAVSEHDREDPMGKISGTGGPRDTGTFAHGLREQADQLAAGIAEAIRDGVPSYTKVEPASLRRSLVQHIETAAASLVAGRVPDHVPDVAVAAERARAGIPIEQVLLAIRMSFQRLREFVVETAGSRHIPPESQLEAVRILWEVNDLVSREYAVAHRNEDLDMARTAESRRAELVRRLLQEGAHGPDMVLRAGSFGLVTGRRYRTFRARPTGNTLVSATLNDVLRWAEEHRLEPVGAIVDGDAAGMLNDSTLPLGGPVLGVGPAVELPELSGSFRLATQALDVAGQFDRPGPQTLERLSLRVAVAAESHVGDMLVEKILGPLQAQGDFGVELIVSLDAFLSAGMNTASAAQRLTIHPNTLRYRINQVKQLSRLSLQSAEEISEVWWALRRREWLSRTGG